LAAARTAAETVKSGMPRVSATSDTVSAAAGAAAGSGAAAGAAVTITPAASKPAIAARPQARRLRELL
jgi:hypothetical protein